MRFCLAALLALSLLATSASAQIERPPDETEEEGGTTATDEERLYDELVARFQKEYLAFTTLLQIAPVIPFEDVEGNQPRFDVAAAWLGIRGRLGENVGYFLRGDLSRDVSLLEATVSYGSDATRGIVGQQKVPFSAEFLTPAANIDMVNRARIVREVVPGRRVGAALLADSGPLRFRAGAFNASYSPRGLPQRARGGLLLAVRVQTEAPLQNGSVRLGANVAYDTPDTSERFDIPGRLLLGADARARLGAVLLAAEFLHADVEGAMDSREGGYVTLGYDLSPDDRVLARLDVLEDSNEIVLGYNRTFTRAASFQANLIVPLDEFAEPFQGVLNFQLAF